MPHQFDNAGQIEPGNLTLKLFDIAVPALCITGQNIANVIKTFAFEYFGSIDENFLPFPFGQPCGQ